MRLRFGVLSIVFGAVALVASGPPASAGVVTETASVGPLDTNFSDPLSFAQFNTGLGTLNSVTMTVSYEFDHSGSAILFAPGTTGASATQNQVTVASTNGSTLLTATGQNYTPSLTLAAGSAQLGQSVNFQPMVDTGTRTVILSGSSLTAFEGNGSVALPVSASSLMTSGSTNNGNAASAVMTQAKVNVELTYSYTAVPEPSSFALLGLGGAGLLWFRRRRAA